MSPYFLKLLTKFTSTVCKDFKRRMEAIFIPLAIIIFIISGGWFRRACCIFPEQSFAVEKSSWLHSENVIRLEVLPEKISTGTWPGFKMEPKMSVDPHKTSIWATPLIQTFCQKKRDIFSLMLHWLQEVYNFGKVGKVGKVGKMQMCETKTTCNVLGFLPFCISPKLDHWHSKTVWKMNDEVKVEEQQLIGCTNWRPA